METIVLENSHLSMRAKDFLKTIDNNFQIYDTNTSDWNTNDDYHLSAMLAQPTIKNIVIDSSLGSILDIKNGEYISQFNHFLILFKEILSVRKLFNLQILNIYLNYKGEDFYNDLDFINDKGNLKLILNSYINELNFMIYKDYKYEYNISVDSDRNYIKII